MSTELLFTMELLPALRRRCHAALCGGNVKFPDGIVLSNIMIDNILDKSVFNKEKAFVVYSEEKTEPLVGEFDKSFGAAASLLRGGTIRQASSDAQVTVYARELKVCYVLGDTLMKSFDDDARQRHDFRYFRLLGRNQAKAEEVDSWTVIYKFRVQLQPSDC